MTEEQQQNWGGDGLGPDDLAIPEAKLIQNVGGGIAKESGALPGDFYFPLTDEIIKGAEGFEIIIAAMQKNRTYWGRSDIVDEPPECACLKVSRDGSGVSVDGKNCLECDKRCDTPWLISSDERRKRCLINYNILAIDMSSLPLLLRTSGLSAQAAKEIYTQLSMNRALHGEWFRAKTRVTSVKKVTASGDSYALKFGKLELLESLDQIEEMKAQAFQLIGTQIALPAGNPDAEIPDLEF